MIEFEMRLLLFSLLPPPPAPSKQPLRFSAVLQSHQKWLPKAPVRFRSSFAVSSRGLASRGLL